MKKTILHLCADIGSDSRFYSLDEKYNVIKIGKEIGVEKDRKLLYDIEYNAAFPNNYCFSEKEKKRLNTLYRELCSEQTTDNKQ